MREGLSNGFLDYQIPEYDGQVPSTISACKDVAVNSGPHSLCGTLRFQRQDQDAFHPVAFEVALDRINEQSSIP